MDVDPTFIKSYILGEGVSEEQRLSRLRVALGVGRVLPQIQLELRARVFRSFLGDLTQKLMPLGYEFNVGQEFWQGEKNSGISWFKPAWAINGGKPNVRFCLAQDGGQLQRIGLGVVKQAPDFPFSGKASALEPASPYFQMYERLRRRLTAGASEYWVVYHDPSGPNQHLFAMSSDELLLDLSTELGCAKASSYFLEVATVMRDELEPLIDEAIHQLADQPS